MNLRPLDPQSSALAKLRHIPLSYYELSNCWVGLELGMIPILSSPAMVPTYRLETAAGLSFRGTRLPVSEALTESAIGLSQCFPCFARLEAGFYLI